MRVNDVTCVSYGSLACAGLILLSMGACINYNAHFSVLKGCSWRPADDQIQRVLFEVEQYCRIRMGDSTNTLERKVGELGAAESISSISGLSSASNQTPLQSFFVNGLPYVEYEKHIGAFVETNRGGTIRFIAVQHIPSRIVHAETPKWCPFTIYYNTENGKIALDTVGTWDSDAQSPFSKPTMIYSPGPPYYLPEGCNNSSELRQTEKRETSTK